MSLKQELIEGINQGDIRSLSKAITLAESKLPEKFSIALEIIEELGPSKASTRIGISGTPGVGKSTFINAYCKELLQTNPKDKIAVLSIDPSSRVSGGSILGDKTRMPDLVNESRVFVRPTASGDYHGGLSRNSRLALLMCEVAGYNRIIVESVGVGQGETEISQLCDLFLLLLNPGGGDDLQGIKRGIVEMADLIVVNKADGEGENIARKTAKDYAMAQHLMHAHAQAPVLVCSALTGFNIPAVAKQIEEILSELGGQAIMEKRKQQSQFWVRRNLESHIMDKLKTEQHEIANEIEQGKLAERIAFELSKTL